MTADSEAPGVELVAEGCSLVAGRAVQGDGPEFLAFNPRTGEEVGPVFREAGLELVEKSTAAAREAFGTLEYHFERGPALLDRAAALMEVHRPEIVERAEIETALSRTRLEGELTRTVNQLRFLAEVAASGERLDVATDNVPNRLALALVRLPIGPVAVFGASNFPLAFSVPGCDTAAALAAGCPVVVKAHEAHPATSELCGRVFIEAVRDCGLHPGWFSLLQGRSALGATLARDPNIKAVAFTGSERGGRALFDMASARPEPIPVYAEMGSINPVFVTAASIESRGEEIVSALAASIIGSGGQLCTKPGVVFADYRTDAETGFASRFASLVEISDEQPLLTPQIRERFLHSLQVVAAAVSGEGEDCGGQIRGGPALLASGRVIRASLQDWVREDALRDEIFGPASVLVAAPEESWLDVAHKLSGSLTASIWLESEEHVRLAPLVRALSTRVGRVVVNGLPTGVRVSKAMFHGGPYPASASARDTSVGACSLDRFLRPVCFQGVPEELLPRAVTASTTRHQSG